MNIYDAIQQLDKDNADHWTTDGQPRLDALKEILGRAVTRKDVTEAMKEAKEAEIDEGMEEDLDDEVDHEPLNNVAKDEVLIQDTPPDGLEAAQKELEDANLELHRAQARVRAANEKMDHYIRIQERMNKRPAAYDIQAYQKSQQDARIKQREKMIAIQQAIHEVNLKF